MATCANGHSSTASDYCDVCGEPIALTPGAASVARAASPASAAPATPPSGSGAPMTSATGSSTGSLTGSSTGALVACPACHVDNAADALFCEDCGYDFTTGQLPPSSTATTSAGAANALSLDPGPAKTGANTNAESRATASTTASPGTGWVAEVWADPDWFALHGKDMGDPCPSASTPKVIVLRDVTASIGRTSKSRGVAPTIDCGTDSAVSHLHATLTFDNDRWFIEDAGSTNGTYVSVAGAPNPDVPIIASSKRELAPNERIQLGAWTRIVLRGALPGE